jgi:dTDP-4-dehydrorhamnose reductase
MRVLVVGGDGMLGHRLLIDLSKGHEVRVTLRGDPARYRDIGLFDPHNAYFDVDVRQDTPLLRALGEFRPEVVVNAVGIVKQRQEASAAIPSIEVNSLFPHRLATMARALEARMIHFSTDCVFSGSRGRYTERDIPDPVDLYGRSKLLGEVGGEGCLTLRTSLIGLELATRRGLVEWFLSNSNGRVQGYRRAIHSGITTAEAARAVELLITGKPLSGVWHLASEAISKYDLLCGLLNKLGRTDIEVDPYDGFVCDRSLDGRALQQATGYVPASWDEMLEGLADDIRKRESAGRVA